MGASTRAISERTFTLQTAAAANGNGTEFDVSGASAALVQVSGTFAATVNFEATLDDTNWVAVEAASLGDRSVTAAPTSSGLYVVPTAGAGKLRARVSGYASGTVTVSARACMPGTAEAVTIGEVGGRLSTVSASFTRPANTTAYAAKDVVTDDASGVQTYTGVARASGGTGYITKAQLLTDKGDVTARFRLHLYNTSAPTGIADNAANTVLYTNAGKYVGYIDFAAANAEGAGSASQSLNAEVRLPFTTVGNANLFGVLEALDAFTPASAEQFTVKLTCDQN